MYPSGYFGQRTAIEHIRGRHGLRQAGMGNTVVELRSVNAIAAETVLQIRFKGSKGFEIETRCSHCRAMATVAVGGKYGLHIGSIANSGGVAQCSRVRGRHRRRYCKSLMNTTRQRNAPKANENTANPFHNYCKATGSVLPQYYVSLGHYMPIRSRRSHIQKIGLVFGKH